MDRNTDTIKIVAAWNKCLALTSCPEVEILPGIMALKVGGPETVEVGDVYVRAADGSCWKMEMVTMHPNTPTLREFTAKIRKARSIRTRFWTLVSGPEVQETSGSLEYADAN